MVDILKIKQPTKEPTKILDGNINQQRIPVHGKHDVSMELPLVSQTYTRVIQ